MTPSSTLSSPNALGLAFALMAGEIPAINWTQADVLQAKADGFGRVALPFKATTDLTLYVGLLKALKAVGAQVLVTRYMDGGDPLQLSAYNDPGEWLSANQRLADLVSPYLTAGDAFQMGNELLGDGQPGIDGKPLTWADENLVWGHLMPVLAAWLRKELRAGVLIGVPMRGDQEPEAIAAVFEGGTAVSMYSAETYDFVAFHLYPSTGAYTTAQRVEQIVQFGQECGLAAWITECGADTSQPTAIEFIREVSAAVRPAQILIYFWSARLANDGFSIDLLSNAGMLSAVKGLPVADPVGPSGSVSASPVA